MVGNTKKDKNGNAMIDFVVSDPYDATKSTASTPSSDLTMATADEDLPF